MKPRRILAYCLAAMSAAALADEPSPIGEDSPFELHAQTTYIRQFKPSFSAPYSGPNSLRAARETSYTLTGTLFVAWRRENTEIYLNPEVVQGVPFSGLHGVGGFSNGEVQRGAGPELRAYRARFFVRQTWNLGGALEEKVSDQNQVKARYAAERFVLTAGNVSVLDVFDVMDYSRDARTQFMNWASLTYGAWDYPADARGYTWGAAAEYITPNWQFRAGRFLVPVESNGLKLESAFIRRYGDVAEVEAPYQLGGRRAIARALVFRNHVNAGAYEDALAMTGSPPDITSVRRPQSKRGFGASTQVEVAEDLGAYVRAGWNDGRTESFMFTEIDRSVAAGTLLKGRSWRRPDDSVGLAVYVNGLSKPHRDYLAAGGQGFFLGDGRLSYATERILETYYSFSLAKKTWLSVGFQRIANPGYNRDRGPADFLSLRLHAEI
jgi:hypothetical protein